MLRSPDVSENRFLPNFDRISVLGGMITLAYILAHYIDVPTRELALQLPGVYLAIQINVNLMVGVLVACLTAAGADWIYRDHPAAKGSVSPYLILPALSALVLGFPLNQVPFGIGWWLVLAGGVFFLTLVLIGEYISINMEDARHPLAGAGLTAVSFALYLILAISLRGQDTRVFLALPGLAIGALLVSLRVLHLRMHGQWLVYEAAIVAVIVGQYSAALYYWPVAAVSFGVLLLGVTYGLVSFISGLIEDKTIARALIEPLVALSLAVVVAIWAS